MLTKQYRLLYANGQIQNTDWDQPQTGYTCPGDGLSSFESDNFADVQALVTSLGLTLPVALNQPTL